MASRLPSLLEQYLALPPEAALIVVTGVVGASTNWLVLRYLCSFLGGSPAGGGDDDDGDGDDTAVLLVSFMRDYSFWRDGAGRLGVDLEALSRKRRFGFLDGLTCLFTGDGGGSVPVPVSQQHPKPLTWSGGSSSITASIIDALEALQQNKTKKKPILIVDQPDLLLAATATTATDVRDMLLDVRERAPGISCVQTFTTIGQGQQQGTGLERAHAALTLGVAHEADILLSLRLLDTGAAGDVGGVLRITRGGGGGLDVEEHEYLYRIGGDGGVRVFERGQ
ncbi:hypothetical protein MAPG_10804 [Magnaporthiopsis poae ATCC 64411]|uniref:Elongator complex protein 6 n=1 Tax=Magnaporthiopsis poae (strain ATCC 64411 / 73-15) TaxID=644358 RepID=A0A0C4EDK2_MAGP6|nr:hypothetical protein MAPG_10804 [Magnaporthiopsis poae ATCC 64411]